MCLENKRNKSKSTQKQREWINWAHFQFHSSAGYFFKLTGFARAQSNCVSINIMWNNSHMLSSGVLCLEATEPLTSFDAMASDGLPAVQTIFRSLSQL